MLAVTALGTRQPALASRRPYLSQLRTEPVILSEALFSGVESLP